MLRQIPTLWLLIGLMFWGAAQDSSQLFPLEALQPNVQGYALTAAEGNLIERFEVRVIALQLNMVNGRPLILVEASGELIDKTGGVAAGMSGSPVYLPYEGDMRLVGAIGYAFPESDARLALVTPFVDMQSVPFEGENSGVLASFGEEHFVGLGEARAISTPLLFNGVHGRAATMLEALLPDGVIQSLPIQQQSVTFVDDDAFVLKPGSAIAVELIRGDISLAAVGTLTHIEGEHFWAFGHPLLQREEVDFALVPAYVTYIVPSSNVAFQLANTGKRLLGTVSQDHAFAIAGTLVQEPNFLPISITMLIDDKTISKHIQVSNDERFLAELVEIASLQILDQHFPSLSAGTVDIAWNIDLADGQRLRMLEQISNPEDIVAASASLSAEPFAILANNMFKEANIEKVGINLSYDPQQRIADIVKVEQDKEQVLEIGSTLRAFVRLQHYREDAEVIELQIPLPEELSGIVDITFRGGSNGPPPEEDSEDDILSFEELLIALREQTQSSELIVEAFVDGKNKRLLQKSYPFLVTGSENLEIELPFKEGEEPDGSSQEEDAPETSLPNDASKSSIDILE